MDQHFVTRIVEAALLAANQPLTLAQLHSLFPEDQPAPADSVEQALEALREGCKERGVELVELASGFRYQVQADVHPWVARLWTERQTRYTRATLETLALIAYRQPITRGEIEQVRGVAVNSNIIKALEEREWIRVVGHRDVPGKPALFGTTKTFLDYFGLKRLDELPPLSELKDIGDLEPQLQFDGPPAPSQIEAGGIGNGGNAEDAQADNDEAGNEDIGDDELGGTEAEADDANVESADDADADTDTDSEAPEPTAVADSSTETGADDTDAGDSADAGQDDTPESVPMDDPDAAPGERAADANDHEQDPHAVETTTVPNTEAESEDDRPEQQK
ncbi:segregation and condensation protein B [Lysobacter sp. Root559]|uniref:SMC-Scp complex subunit ScpB n=1 Tax=Lysobacter sp. Root559 TaxID=1736559 RepID=UPI0006F83E73|nr:SMC-Scp complex subunit ScpB [Lysobacter sp. Root559]KQZ67808.1 segregation and condensation protein B [Lysobacter sp. Root559]